MDGPKILDRRVFSAGQLIFKEGDLGGGAYLLQTGVVEIVKRRSDGSEFVLGTIRPGGLFGEMALIDDQPRMASARAKEATVCVLVGRAQFQQKVADSDPLVRALLNIFCNYIRVMANQQAAMIAADAGDSLWEIDDSVSESVPAPGAR